MDYEKKYNEALERARQIKDGKDEWRYSDLAEIIPALTEILPELAESEDDDEKIRKEIIDIVEAYRASCVYEGTHRFDDCLAYLEKQKEQNPSDFPAGFYITFPDGKKYYTKEMRCNGMNVKVVEPKPAEWHSEDEQNLNVCLSYIKDESLRSWLIDAIHVRYDKPDWSEEDEKIMQTMIKEGDLKPSEIAWLKSLRPSWKPSEEQMMRDAVKWLVDDDYDELTDKGKFILGSVGIGYNGYYIPYSDLLKLPKED